MTFIITKTTNSTPYSKTFDTIQDIINFLEKEDEKLIIKSNFWYNEPVKTCMKYWKVSENIAKQIVSAKYEIEIYDDYRE